MSWGRAATRFRPASGSSKACSGSSSPRKTPFDLLRGFGGEEKILKNAKDTCATEALEIATYTAIEQLAEPVGDQKTARLAASIRADEERMLARVMRALRPLSEAVVGAEVDGDPSYDIGETGAAETAKATARSASATTSARRAQARKVPGVTRPRVSPRAPSRPSRTWRSRAMTS